MSEVYSLATSERNQQALCQVGGEGGGEGRGEGREEGEGEEGRYFTHNLDYLPCIRHEKCSDAVTKQ